MSETPSVESVELVPLPQSFQVKPYQPDGGFSFGGALQLIGFLGLTGIALGAVASYVSRFFYLILVFPIAIGLAIGFVGTRCIRTFKIRRPLTCGVAGFVAGCLAMLAMHHFDYRNFQSEVAAAFGENLPALQDVAKNLDTAKAGLASLPEAERDDWQGFINELEQDPEFRRLLLVESFPDYMRFQAHQGVELKRAARDGPGLNLGYWGSWIYWIVEALIVAVLAFINMRGEASNPFCSDCSDWKVAETWGPFSQGERIRQSLSEGRIDQFGFDPAAGGTVVTVTAYRCPHCLEDGEMDVRLEKLTVNSKGEVHKADLLRTTFPASAYAAVLTGCTPTPSVQDSSAEGDQSPSPTDDIEG